MGKHAAVAAAVVLALLAGCSDFEPRLGRDGRGRVLTGTVLDLPDELTYAEPLVIVGATPWGAIHACPEGELVAAQTTGSFEGRDSDRATDAELIGAVWQRLGVVEGPARSADLFVVPPDDLTIGSAVVAAPWIPDTEEPIAAWYTLDGTRITSSRSCTGWIAD